MSKIDREEVRRIARLAHLERPAGGAPLIADATLDRLARDMEQILGYVGQLEAVDVSNVPPTHHGIPLPTFTRPDRPEDGIDPESLLRGAPARTENAISVPKILE